MTQVNLFVHRVMAFTNLATLAQNSYIFTRYVCVPIVTKVMQFRHIDVLGHLLTE